MTSAPTESPRTRLPPSYWRLWSSSVVSNLGDGVAAVAYPWLASAVTRNGVLIATIAVAQQLPRLLFTLPAGIITDRNDRRRIIILIDLLRFVLTIGVAVVVLAAESDLPSPADLAGGLTVDTNMAVYVALLAATVLFGFGEVLRDNAAVTLMPTIVPTSALERANGNLWGAELVMNSFVGPPLGSLLIGAGFAAPFFFDGGSFAVAAALVFMITGEFRPNRSVGADREGWRAELRTGFRWLWDHPLLRPMAIILGLLNGLGALATATLILFAQEILEVTPLTFALLSTGGAVGGVAGSLAASRVSRALGSGRSLYLAMIGSGAVSFVIGLSSSWPVAWIVLVVFTFLALLWNVITVSLRQTIIPDELLGRVNSVYRFFGLGMTPIGAALGGLVFVLTDALGSRELALRMPFLVTGTAYFLLLPYAMPRLTTEKIEAARAAGMAAHEDSEPGGA